MSVYTRFTGLSLRGTSLFKDGLTGAVFDEITNSTSPGQRWQFYPYNASVYLLRCEEGGPDAFLAAARGSGSSSDPASSTTGDTVPIMSNLSISDSSIFWQIAPWGDGTYYFSNLANGSDWRLNTLSTALMAMDSNITTEQSGEHYQFSSMGTIGNSRYSTMDVIDPASSHIALHSDLIPFLDISHHHHHQQYCNR